MSKYPKVKEPDLIGEYPAAVKSGLLSNGNTLYKTFCCLSIAIKPKFLSATIAANVRVFAKAGNSLIVQPGTNAHVKIYC
jgi:hypothetical protein